MAFGNPVVQKTISVEDHTEGEAIVAVQLCGQYESTDDRGVEPPIPVDIISDKYKSRFNF